LIVHAIIKYATPIKRNPVGVGRPKFKGKEGSLTHKQYILGRAYDNCNFKINDTVVFKKQEYIINCIYGPEEINWIDWVGLSPQFIELLDTSSNVYMYANPGMLRKVGYKRRK